MHQVFSDRKLPIHRKLSSEYIKFSSYHIYVDHPITLLIILPFQQERKISSLSSRTNINIQDGYLKVYNG